MIFGTSKHQLLLPLYLCPPSKIGLVLFESRRKLIAYFLCQTRIGVILQIILQQLCDKTKKTGIVRRNASADLFGMFFDVCLQTGPCCFQCARLHSSLAVFILIFESTVKIDDITKHSRVFILARDVFLLIWPHQSVVSCTYLQENTQFVHQL
jgi:hypothetical protein